MCGAQTLALMGQETGEDHDAGRDRARSALVSLAQQESVEHADRRQSRLDVRWLRDLRGAAFGRRRVAPTARSIPIWPDSRLCRFGHRHDAAGLGHRWPDRRCARGLPRAQADHDAGDPRLFNHDGPECICVGLGFVRGSAFFSRRRHRLRVGDRDIDRIGAVARPGTSARRWADAMRFRHRLFPRVLHLAVCRGAGSQWVAVQRKRSGETLGAEELALTRITLVDLFADPEVRRRIILASLMSLGTTFAFWAIGAWIPPYVAAAAIKAGLDGQLWASYAAMANTGASVIGYVAFGFLADALGRKAVTILYVVAAFLSVPLTFVWADGLPVMVLAAALSGAFVTGQYTWMAAWLPELFPTRVRATAAGFVFNMPRLIAWLGPIISGWIIANLGGFSHAAVVIALVYIVSFSAALFLPETKGKPLPV